MTGSAGTHKHRGEVCVAVSNVFAWLLASLILCMLARLLNGVMVAPSAAGR